MPSRTACAPLYFNPRSPCGERPAVVAKGHQRRLFQPTLPVRGATGVPVPQAQRALFQPTLPVRGATRIRPRLARAGTFQPTLPVRGATCREVIFRGYEWISTHAPRAGSDVSATVEGNWFTISTHAPRAGSDQCAAAFSPCRRDFNPRSPCGERQAPPWSHTSYRRFQPTLPVRGATNQRPHLRHLHQISTHAPRAGSDIDVTLAAHPDRDFNPRSPCGERRAESTGRQGHHPFQPTLPVRGATLRSRWRFSWPLISTHAPRAGSDAVCGRTISAYRHDFNPRSPCGERRGTLLGTSISSIFQPTLPVRGATGAGAGARFRPRISTHAPRAGSDL